jgi:hypothetical protein
MVMIVDADELYRRLIHYHVLPDHKVSSAAFKDKKKRPDPSISVDLARMTTPQESLSRAGIPNMHLGALLARIPREVELCVRHDPLDDNQAHSLIEGQNDDDKCRWLAENTEVIM